MAKTIKVVLGETEYTVPHLNLGEVEEVEELFANSDGASLKRPYALLEIVLRRASPKVENVRLIEAPPAEVHAAIDAAFLASGLKTTESASAEGNEPAPATAGGSSG